MDDTQAGAPELTDVHINLVRPKAPVTGRVVASHSCMNGRSSSFVRHWSVDVSGTPLAGTFKAGQAFGIVAPGVGPKGKPHKARLYSISCPSWGEDGEGAVLSTCVKRVIEERSPLWKGVEPTDHSLYLGVCSNYMCDLPVGSEVQVTGPAGKRFVLPRDPAGHNYVFIATGTGIAPFRGMVLELLTRPQGPVPGQVHLIMGVPYSTDLLYHDEFLALAERFGNFTYHQAISREHFEGRWGRYTHHVLDDQFALFQPLLADPRTLLYLCGLQGMELGMYQALAANGASEPYLRVPEDLQGIKPWDWDWELVRRRVKPTKRMLVEVY